jgi:hypothetical protein
MTINRYCSNCSHFDVDGTKYHNACPHNTRPVAKVGEAFLESCGNWVPAGGLFDSSDLDKAEQVEGPLEGARDGG